MLPLPRCKIKKDATQRSNIPSHVEFNCTTGHRKFLSHNLIFLKLALFN